MAVQDTLRKVPGYNWVTSKIRNKLLVLLALVALLPMTLLGYSMYQSASNGIKNQAFAQLTAIRTVKAKQIEDYFTQIDNQIQTFSQNLAVVEAMKEFPAALASARSEVQVDEEQMSQMKQNLLGYYQNEFGRVYKETTNTNPNLKAQIAPLDEDSIYLQYQYISSNPNPLGSKETLDKADDGTTYSQLHLSLIHI